MKATRQPRLRSPIVAFTGGGTGGHVYPGLAVLERLPPPLADRTLWIGSRRGVERSIVSQHGVRYVSIATGKLRRYVSFRNLVDPLLVIAGVFQARRILRRHRVTTLFSKGGFVAVPVVFAAWTLNIRIAIHESDSQPGLATRLTAPLAQRVFLARESNMGSRRVAARTVVVGNPIRRAVAQGRGDRAFRHFGEEGKRFERTNLPLLLVLGGSLGARQINALVWANLESLCSVAVVIHQVGANDEVPASAVHTNYLWRESYGDELGDLYARAGAIVSRAGAGSLAEIAAHRIPAVLLPLSPRVSRGDQVDNAREFVRAGVAVSLDTDRTGPDEFASVVCSIVSDGVERDRMREAYRHLPNSDAAEAVAAWIRS